MTNYPNPPKPLRLTWLLVMLLAVGMLTLLIGKEQNLQAESAMVSAQLSDAGEPSETYLPLVVNRFDASLPPPVFGMQTYGNTLPSNKYYDDLMASGTTWVRIPIHWSAVEPVLQEPKVYNWTSVDNALAAATSTGGNLNIIANIYTAPQWAAPDHPRAVLYDEALPHFATFVHALAERYSGNGINDAPGSPVVTHWEFYNEPDIATEPGGVPLWGDNGDKYAQMLATVYPAVKAGNPNAKVVFGGIAYDWFVDQGGGFVREFLDDVLDAGGGNYFDIMNFHSYPAFSINWSTQGAGLLEKATYIRNKLQNEYAVYKPMVVTEAGWYSNPDPIIPSTPEIQSRYVVQLYTQAMAADIDVMIWWMLYDVGIGYPDTGLVTNDTLPVRKPAFFVYKNMTEEMWSTHFERKLTLAETGNDNMEAYQFRDYVRQRTLYIAWLNPIDSNETHPLRITAPLATLKSIEGNIIGVVADGDDGVIDGRVTIEISSRPIYIEVNH